MKKIARFLLLFLTISLLIFLLFYVRSSHFFSLATWQKYAYYFQEIVYQHYGLSVLFYIVGYAIIVVTGVPLFIPVTLIAGYLFGVWRGLLYAVISANAGAIASFLITRYLLHRFLAQRYAQRLIRFKQRMAKEGYAYLLSLHLAMIFPYVVINTVAALSDIPLFTFFWTTLLGSFPFIFINVLAGRQLQLMTTTRVVPPYVWLFLIILAFCIILPVIMRNRLSRFKKERL